MISALE
jgi:ankyrin repeat protein